MTHCVEFDVKKDVATIVLNRPRSQNAIDAMATTELERIVRTLDRSRTIRFVVLTGAGSTTFSAGSDAKFLETLSPPAARAALVRRLSAVLDRLSNGPQIAIASINGSALAGGCEILSACHFRIAASTATFSLGDSKDGRVVSWGGGLRLFDQVGTATALRLLLTARTITAIEARGIGLVDSVVPRSTIADAVNNLIRTLRASSRSAQNAFLELANAARHEARKGRTRQAILCEDKWVFDDFWGTGGSKRTRA